MKRLLIYIIFLMCNLTPRLCSAAFSGFPLTEGTNYSWYTINAQYAPIAQIYSGIVERCDLTGVTAPSWTQTLQVDDSTNSVYSIEVTNAIGPVDYAYGTAYPRVTHAMLAGFDDVIEDLIPKFASTNMLAYPDAGGGAYTKATFFLEAGIGLVYTNVIMIGTNAVTNIVSRWTRSPERRWTENLVEMHRSTNDWVLISATPVEWFYPSASNAVTESQAVTTNNVFPVVLWGPTSTTWSVSLSGIDLYGSNRTESVTTGSPCTVPWHSITATPVVTGFDGSVTGAWFAVQYTNNLVVYGDRPYRLYASDLDERYFALTKLTRTSIVQPGWTNGYAQYWAGGDSDSSWSTAKTTAEANWHPLSTNLVGSGRLAAFYRNQLIRYGSSSFYAGLQSVSVKPYVRGISTNLSKSVTWMVYVEANLDDIADLASTAYVFDDFLTGYETGKWSVVSLVTNSLSADVDSPYWFPTDPSTPPLPWYATDPPTNGASYVKTIGSTPYYGFKALIDWDFQYK